jgi:hypothetical protein
MSSLFFNLSRWMDFLLVTAGSNEVNQPGKKGLAAGSGAVFGGVIQSIA